MNNPLGEIHDELAADGFHVTFADDHNLMVAFDATGADFTAGLMISWQLGMEDGTVSVTVQKLHEIVTPNTAEIEPDWEDDDPIVAFLADKKISEIAEFVMDFALVTNLLVNR